jgi:hypothetical protein
MKTLILATDSFDQVNSFNVNAGRRVMTAHLKQDYDKVGDGIYWALSTGSVLKDKYTAADVAERDRLNSETPLQHGEIVLIDGEQYKTRVLGNYSNCAIFDKI